MARRLSTNIILCGLFVCGKLGVLVISCNLAQGECSAAAHKPFTKLNHPDFKTAELVLYLGQVLLKLTTFQILTLENLNADRLIELSSTVQRLGLLIHFFGRSTMKILGLLCVAALLTSCEDPHSGQDGGEEGGNQLEIKLRGSNLASISSSREALRHLMRQGSTASDLPVNCNDFFKPSNVSSGALSGSCITPISITGSVVSINLAGFYYGGGIRLLGGGSGLGQNFILEGEDLDLTDPQSLGGEDNAQDTGLENVNEYVGTEFNYLDVKFAVPRTGDETSYWTYRYAFMSYPFTSETVYTYSEPTPGNVTYTDTGTTVADCLNQDFPEAAITATQNNTNMLGGATGVKAGDILVCIKGTAEESCASEDFLWLNTNSDAFTSTRPTENSDVFQFTSLANHKVTCSYENPGFNLDLGGFSFNADLYNDIQFTAEFDGAQKFYEFKYEGASETTRGEDMSLFIDYDVRNSLFVEGVNITTSEDYSEYEAITSDGALAQLVWLKPILLWQDSPCLPWQPSQCDDASQGIRSQVSVTLSGATEPTVYICEDDTDDHETCVAEEDTFTP